MSLSAATPGPPPAGRARLGPRLLTALELCPSQGPVADVGSGHGGLAVELRRRRPGRVVFATEAKPGPAAELRRLVHPDAGVLILEGQGLLPLQGLGCRGAVIAGMGGGTIAEILARGQEVLGLMDWLVLQPAQRAERLTGWIDSSGWSVSRQVPVREGGHQYSTLLLEPS